MTRRAVLWVCSGLLAGVGCGLLTPYPGDGDPSTLLGQSRPDGRSPFEDGDPQSALVDPAFDNSVTIISNEEVIVAIPGEAFTVDLDFEALNENVVGGGIQFPGSDEVQWTFIADLEFNARGRIQFGYVVDAAICGEVPALCHEILTKQFAVARNTAADRDVDGDGSPDGEFVVSPPREVPVILRCASCDSPSCREIEVLAGECQACTQPQACEDAWELCFAEGRPKFETDEADDFERFFGPNGLAWKSNTVCIEDEDGNSPADTLCEDTLASLTEECMDVATSTGADAGSGTDTN